MTHHFYSHIIEIHSIYIELDLLDMTPKESKELREILESSIHHAVMDTMLSELSHEHKKIFLSHVHEGNHEVTWQLLNKHVRDAEKKISNVVEKLKKQMKNDIKKAKQQTTLRAS